MEESERKRLYEQALKAQSAEEIAGIAEGAGIKLAEGEAEALFERLHSSKSGEVADEELEAVAGGGCSSSTPIRPGVDCCIAFLHKCRATCEYYRPSKNNPDKEGKCVYAGLRF